MIAQELADAMTAADVTTDQVTTFFSAVAQSNLDIATLLKLFSVGPVLVRQGELQAKVATLQAAMAAHQQTDQSALNQAQADLDAFNAANASGISA